MTTTPRQDEPAKRREPAPQRGAPPTYTAHAVRRDLSVRVWLSRATAPSEPEELREHGYGFGV